MTRRGGFTVVELIITITIMAILLTLSVIGLRSTQANGRDEERKTDTANIARTLEEMYPHVYNSLIDPKNNTPTQSGYPSTAVLTAFFSGSYGDLGTGSFAKSDLQAPGVTGDTTSLVMATNSSQNPASVTPQPTTDTYVYQPLSGTYTPVNELCSAGGDLCRKFNLYYKLETDSTIQIITSKNQ